MMQPKIEDYKITDRLAESKFALVRRGHRTQNGEPVVLKTLKPGAFTKDELARFRREFEITSRPDLPGVVRAVALEDYSEGLTIVFEDIGGKSLDRIVEQAPLSLTDFFELGIALADTVGLIHKEHIIHKAINPSNIIFNPITKQVNLIDFGLADDLRNISTAPLPLAAFETILAYSSPEQTGRMNRPLDYRTDFYSLGVTFYQVLTGKLPFEADDALGIVHSHIAKTPVPPHEINSDIPEMVSLIVMKLMSKMADDRYQSGFGLKADLDRCLRALRDEGTVRAFELGLEDFSERLRFPEKLYGREEELDQLFHAFYRVSLGERELVLVGGYPGVGKTRLVREIHPRVIEKQGYLVEGKFDQVQRNVPYFAWLHALSGFVNYILMEGEARLERWKDKIQSAVGDVGKVLTDVIPNLELVIGDQPEVPKLGGSEAQNRFKYVFVEFIKAIATGEHPLVVFLDDLHWIDAASLNLLQTLVLSAEVSNLLVIGAYRDNEVDASHPLARCIEALREEQTRVNPIALGNISEQTVNALLADVLYRKRPETAELTHLIHSKTGGNPFFLIETLKTLVEKEVISFDIKIRLWKWDLAALKTMEITDNVAILMVMKIRQLPVETQQVFSLAACIGYRFNPSNVGIIGEQPDSVIMERLQPAQRDGLIVAVDGEYQFAHDRVQHAAYTLIPIDERPVQHLRIGRLLLSHTPRERLSENVFDIVGHLNRGAALITAPAERERLAELNAAAGRKARDSIAFETARDFFAAAALLLPEDAWDSRYDFQFALFLDWAQAEYLCGEFDKAELLFDTLLTKAEGALDKAAVYRMRLALYPVSGRYDDALAMGIAALHLLGVEIPGDDETLSREIRAEAEAVKARLHGRSVEELARAPEATDPRVKAVSGLLAGMGAPAYIGSRPQVLPLLVLKNLSYALEYGVTKDSCHPFIAYGHMLASDYGDPESGYAFSEAALELNKRFDDPNTRGAMLYLHGNHINFWVNPISTNFPILEEGFRTCLDSGNLAFANYVAYSIVWQAFERGDSLGDVLGFSREYASFALGSRNEAIYRTIVLEQQFLRCLMNATDGSTSFSDGEVSELSCVEKISKAPFTCGVTYYHTMKMMAACLMGDSSAARTHAEKAGALLAAVVTQPMETTFYFLNALVSARACREAPEQDREKFLQTLYTCREKLAFWAEHCPANFAGKHALVSAEIAEIEHDELSAERLFEQAIESARENGFIHWEAMAGESAARFYASRGLKSVSRACLREARFCYARWGAEAKVRQLEREHPWLIETGQPDTATIVKHLDAVSIAKAQRTISSEIEMDKLLGEVMRIVIESAGAQSGFLLLEKNGVWQIAAKGGIGTAEVKTSLPVGAEESDLVPRSVVHYVARTKESVVLDDASNRGEFTNDPHIRRKRTRSLLCAPLLSRGRLIGILYLENNLTAQAFTTERVELLGMLLSQAAISLENARIYEALRESEVKYRRIVDTSSEGIWILGPDLATTFVNERMAAMTGYTAEELMGRPFTHVMFEEDRQDHYQKLETRKQGIRESYERRLRHKDGRTVWALASATPVFDDKDQFNGIFAMFTDITERKQAAISLSEQLHFLQQLLDSIPIPVYYKHKDGSYLGCNGAFEAFMGVSRSDVVGKTVSDLVPKERTAIHDKTDLKLLNHPGVLSYELNGIFRNGRYHDLIFHKATFFDADGCVAGTVGTLVDITESKQAERERLANLKFFESMDQVNRAIQSADDPEKMMQSLLDVVLSIFDCDRAFLVYPCDPDAQTWTVQMESTKPEHPGITELNLHVPMDAHAVDTFRLLLASDGPVAFGPGTQHENIGFFLEQLSVKSFLLMAIYPKTGSPWEFGLHQCARVREWTQEEKRLFEAIGRRLADALSLLLSYRDLRNNEEFLDKIVEHIPNMIFVKDAQTQKYVRLNDAGERLLGYKQEELLGKTVYDLFPGEVAEFIDAMDRDALKNRSLVDIPEETIVNRNNELRFLHTKKIPILDENGTPQYLLIISEDVTERRQAEESIRKLTEAIEQSPVSIVITDVAGRIEFVNAKFTQITGYTSEEAVGQNPSILKSGDTPDAVYRELWDVISSGRVWQGEFRNRKKNGELFWENATIAPVRNAANVITHYVALKEDITERKKLEEQLRQAQKMEAVGRLAGGVAHDFNNMLSVILGYCELIISKLRPFDPILAPLKAVQSAANRSADLTRQLLAFSRKQTIAPRLLDLNEQTKTMERLLTRIIGEDIELAFMLSERLWPVYMDPTQVDQLLANLAINSRDAMPEGGKLTVETSNITLDSEYGETHLGFRPGDFVMLAVSDTGCGMDRETLDHVFEPFFTTKPEGKGTGLGLATVYGIVKQNEGHVDIYSEPGRGTTVKLYLPRYSGLEEAVKAPIVEGWSPGGGETILLVEDEGALREMVKTMLERLGYTVFEANGPEEAIVFCEDHPAEIHLLLTDVVMPNMNGKELEAKIRAIKPGIRTLFMSGYTANAIAHLGVLEKGVRLLQKPFSLDVLSKKVREALSATVQPPGSASE